MAILGFTFNEINVKRKDVARGSITVNNNVQITNISEAKIGATQAVKIEFTFTTSYTPDIGKIEIKGELIYLPTIVKAEELLQEWKEKKLLKEEAAKEVLDVILARAHVEALILSREVNLPSPLPLPRTRVEKKEDSNKDSPGKKK